MAILYKLGDFMINWKILLVVSIVVMYLVKEALDARSYYVHGCEWHRWYAWKPVRLKSGKWKWLQYVERRFYESGSSSETSINWTEHR